MRAASIRTVLFDVGNTLLHLDYGFVAGVLAAHGHPVTPGDVRVAEYGAKAAVDRALASEGERPERIEGLLWQGGAGAGPSYFSIVLHGLGVPRDEAPPILAALAAYNRAACLWRVVDPGTGAVLEALRARGLTLGVVSNADGRVEADLERAGLRRHFATVVDSHVVGVEKPDRAIFELALARLRATPDTALYVGDVFGIDVRGARGAGLAAILMDPIGRYPTPVDCARIRALDELLTLLPAQRATKR